MKLNFSFSPQEMNQFCKRQLFANQQVTKLQTGVELSEKTEVFRGSIDNMKK